jgi:hypothetical protein
MIRGGHGVKPPKSLFTTAGKPGTMALDDPVRGRAPRKTRTAP